MPGPYPRSIRHPAIGYLVERGPEHGVNSDNSEICRSKASKVERLDDFVSFCLNLLVLTQDIVQVTLIT